MYKRLQGSIAKNPKPLEMSRIEKGLLQPITFEYKWQIERFFADCEKVGDFYTSPVFSIKCFDTITEWYLKIYPRGKTETSEDSVAIRLIFHGKDVSEVTVDYRISIVNEQNNLTNVSKARAFKGPIDNWGWTNFVDGSVLRDIENGALINDKLTISCGITFLQITQGSTEIFQNFDELHNKIGNGFEDYEQLLEDSYFSDVTFNIQDKKLYLHKAILMCRNSVFKAMFESKMKEKKESLVEITDIDYKVMKELFRFIYSGKVQNIEEIAKDLLIAAEKYDVELLKVLCERALYDNLNIDNAIEYLKLTDMCNTIHLRSAVIKFVASHYKAVAKMPGFAELNSHVMHQIILSIAERD